jgi:hypothetical protein
VHCDGQTPLRCRDHRQSGDLGGTHHGRDVVLREHPLDCDNVRDMGIEPLIEFL